MGDIEDFGKTGIEATDDVRQQSVRASIIQFKSHILIIPSHAKNDTLEIIDSDRLFEQSLFSSSFCLHPPYPAKYPYPFEFRFGKVEL